MKPFLHIMLHLSGEYFKEIPIQVVLDSHIGLQGAANYGYQLGVKEKARGKNAEGHTSKNSHQY